MSSEISVVKGFTKPLTTPYVVDSDKRIVSFTIQVMSGTCNLLGEDKVAGEDSAPITLPTGSVVTISANNTSGVCDGWTITPAGGTTNLIVQR